MVLLTPVEGLGKGFFFEKKKQKTFVWLSHGGVHIIRVLFAECCNTAASAAGVHMAYNIHAECEIGAIVTRRVLAQRAVKQAREYRRRGFTQIRIVEVESGKVFDVQSLAQLLQGPQSSSRQN